MTTKASSLRNEHADRAKYLPKVVRTRHAVEGGDAIFDNRGNYLPRLADQDVHSYDAYAKRPCFYDATARTKEAMSGLVFSRPYTAQLPKAVEEFLDDIDFGGASFEDFARMLIDEELEAPFGAIVVNHNGDPENPGTLADPSGRPYLSYYPAESVLDWRFGKVRRKGPKELVFLKVFECVPELGGDEFSTNYVEQFRVFDIVTTTEGKTAYRQRVFREVEPTQANPSGIVQIGADSYPRVNGQPWEYMPIVFREKPGPIPLQPIADTNISHWRTSADLEHGAHFTALPTPYVAGLKLNQGEKLVLGSETAIVLEDPQASCGFMEFSGAGLGALEKLIDRKESHMAALGARMLAPEKKQSESGEALSIRSGGESGALHKVATNASTMLTKAMHYVALWSGVSDVEAKKVSVKLNTQFVHERLQPGEIDSLLKAWQGGAMSLDTFLFNLQRGNRLPEGRTVEDEVEKIEEGPEPLGTITANDNVEPDEPVDDEVPPGEEPPAPAKKKRGRKAKVKDAAA